MKIVSKDFCTFTAISVYKAIKFPTIQMVDIFFSLVWQPACLPYPLNLFFDIFKSFPLFIMIEFWVLANMLTLPI